MGMNGCALKSWSAAQRLNKSLYAGKLLRRYTNDYGMAKQSCSEQDDWKAFYSVQLTGYLSTKKSGRLGTNAEKDMIWDLIREAWREFMTVSDTGTLSSEEKMAMYRAVRIIFPTFSVPHPEDSKTEIAVNFAKQRKLAPGDLCYCGSGLSYKMCCGRALGIDELNFGLK